MKGFLALAAVNRLLAADRLGRPLALLVTYDEEVGTLGARALAEAGGSSILLPSRTIVGEPTGLRPVRLHKGHLRLRLVTTGVPAHSAYPARGRSAVEPAARAIVALADLDRRLRQEVSRVSDRFTDTPFSSLNVGRVVGGTTANVVPDRCEVLIGLRLLPGIDPAVMTDRVETAIRETIGDADWILETVGLSPSMESSANADVYRTLQAEVGDTTDQGVAFATDAGWLERLGHACVIFGPGSIEVAHRPNEWMDSGELARAGEIVDRQIRRWCGASG
jgi:acetylornithine deacetylase